MANGSFGGGDGSSGSPFLVEDALDLNAIRNHTVSYYYKQKVSFSVLLHFPAWIPIATDGYGSFLGYYDGNSKEIRDLTESLFTAIAGDVSDRLHHIKLIDVNINVTRDYVGALVGSIGWCSNIYTVPVSYIAVTGNIVSTGDYIGGVVGQPGIGYSIGGLQDLNFCVNLANITGRDYVGGIAGGTTFMVSGGSGYGRINNCRNYGVITARYWAGGIFGYHGTYASFPASNTFAFTVNLCVNSGNIVLLSTGTGIAGGLQNQPGCSFSTGNAWALNTRIDGTGPEGTAARAGIAYFYASGTNLNALEGMIRTWAASQKNTGVSAGGNCYIDTGQAASGLSSATFDGNSWITVPVNGTLFAFGTLDFEIEFDVMFAALGVYGLFTRYAGLSNYTNIYANVTGTSASYVAYNEVTYGFTNPVSVGDVGKTLNANTWYNIKVGRAGTDFYILVDGVSWGSQLGVTYDIPQWSNIVLGAFRNTGPLEFKLNGWMDNVKITVDGSLNLWLEMEGPNGSTVFNDSALYPGGNTTTFNSELPTTTITEVNAKKQSSYTTLTFDAASWGIRENECYPYLEFYPWPAFIHTPTRFSIYLGTVKINSIYLGASPVVYGNVVEAYLGTKPLTDNQYQLSRIYQLLQTVIYDGKMHVY